KFAAPLLNTLCCHYHELNLASLSSSKNLTGQAGIRDQVEKRKPAKQTADKNNSFLDSSFTLKIILPAKMLPKTLHNIMCTYALFSVHDHFFSLKP
ncbi:MAG: hypothetical protein OER74_19165, partial [Desulfobacteraceae bacterium]|nr:hypothetical protein [Desulfobacteraceae bacterium]